MRRLTQPPQGFSGDYMPAFSPDGRALVFARLSGWSASEIHFLSLDGDEPGRRGHALTNEGRWAVSPVWMRDGRSVAYLSGDNGGRMELRRIAVHERGRSERLADLEGDAFQLSLRSHLIYSRETSDTNIWRAAIDGAGEQPAVGQVLITSTRQDLQPRYSPDGGRIAFGSTRSGAREIWIADRDGANPVQLTSFAGPYVGFMNWSPDGNSLIFHARPNGQADLFTVSSRNGRSPVRLTTDAADDVTASYSHDGRWIYFASLRSGQWEAWRMPAGGGAATQISHTGGVEMPLASADGRFVYYCIPGDGIWRVPAAGGDAVRIVGPIAPVCGFVVDSAGIYYSAPGESGRRGAIRFFSFGERRSRAIVLSDLPLGMGLTVSADRRQILFTRVDQSGSDLMLIGSFDTR
jgi:Tol biopolymer transport system component